MENIEKNYYEIKLFRLYSMKSVNWNQQGLLTNQKVHF